MYRISKKHFICFKTKDLIDYISNTENKSFYLDIKHYKIFFLVKRNELNEMFT